MVMGNAKHEATRGCTALGSIAKLGFTASASLSLVLTFSGVGHAAQASARVTASVARAPSASIARVAGPVRGPGTDGFSVLSTLEIADVSNDEGNDGKTSFDFVVTLDPPASTTVTVDFATSDGSATLADNDYEETSGTLTIPPKTGFGTISIAVNGDNKREADETFFVKLSNPSGATIAGAEGIGTIVNDDGSLSI